MFESSFDSEVQSMKERLCYQTTDVTVTETSGSLESGDFHTGPRALSSTTPHSSLRDFASSNSPLTEQVKLLGGSAMRFTIQDGDLSTWSGKRKLWSVIEHWQPEHVWCSPECGPWGGWSRFNQQRSLTSYDDIMQKRRDQEKHLQLCVQICKYQIRQGRHFHFEHPIGSEAFATPSGQDMQKATLPIHLDMCAFGLKVPNTQLFLRKKKSPAVHVQLNAR